MSAGVGMVARAGANLRHIAPTHPAARRCGSLTLPHRRSAPRKPAGRQKRHRRTSPPQRRRTNAAGIGVGVVKRIGGYAPPRPAPLAAAGVRGETKARADAEGGFGLEAGDFFWEGVCFLKTNSQTVDFGARCLSSRTNAGSVGEGIDCRREKGLLLKLQ